MDAGFTQQMLDFYKRTVLLNNDASMKVSVHGPHLAMAVQCNALDPALYVTIDCVNCVFNKCVC